VTGAPGPRLAAWLAKVDSRKHVRRSSAWTARQSNGSRSASLVTLAGAPGAVDLEGFLQRAKGRAGIIAWLLAVTLAAHGPRCALRVRLSRPACRRAAQRLAATLSRTRWTLHVLERGVRPGCRLELGLDPSMGTFVTESHIPLACAPEPLRVLPIVADRSGDGEARPEPRSDHSARAAFDAGARELAAHRYPVGGLSRRWAATSTRTWARQGLKPAVGVSLSLVSVQDAFAPEWSHASHRSVECAGWPSPLSNLAVEAAGPRGSGSTSDKGSGSEESLSRAGGSAASSARTASPCGEIPSASAAGPRRAPRFPDHARRLAQSIAGGLGVDPTSRRRGARGSS
jgi:hypothetical protein